MVYSEKKRYTICWIYGMLCIMTPWKRNYDSIYDIGSIKPWNNNRYCSSQLLRFAPEYWFKKTSSTVDRGGAAWLNGAGCFTSQIGYHVPQHATSVNVSLKLPTRSTSLLLKRWQIVNDTQTQLVSRCSFIFIIAAMENQPLTCKRLVYWNVATSIYILTTPSIKVLPKRCFVYYNSTQVKHIKQLACIQKQSHQQK